MAVTDLNILLLFSVIVVVTHPVFFVSTLIYPWLNLAILKYNLLSYLGDPDWVGASEHQPGNPRGNCGMLFFCCLLTFHLYYPTII